MMRPSNDGVGREPMPRQRLRRAGLATAMLAAALVGASGAIGQRTYYGDQQGSRFISFDLLQIAVAQKRMNAAERRASMVALIRRNARRAAPALDDAYFEAACRRSAASRARSSSRVRRARPPTSRSR